MFTDTVYGYCKFIVYTSTEWTIHKSKHVHTTITLLILFLYLK